MIDPVYLAMLVGYVFGAASMFLAGLWWVVRGWSGD